MQWMKRVENQDKFQGMVMHWIKRVEKPLALEEEGSQTTPLMLSYPRS